MNRIKTDIRNKLGNEMLSSLMISSIEGPELLSDDDI